MSSILDEKRRVVIPKDIAEGLGLTQGSVVIFEKRNGAVVIKKAVTREDPFSDLTLWKPRRTGKPANPSPGKMKAIWHERP